MAGREVRDFTNLSDPKGEDEGDGCYFMSDSHKQIADKKWSSNGGKDKTDDEDLAFKRMVAKMQEVAGERGGYLHGRGALDSDDLLYLKEQMEAEEDAERLRRRTEKRAFAAFKISSVKAASLVDAASLTTLPSIRVEPKPRSGIRQNVLVKSIVEVKPKRLRCEEPSSRSGVARTTDAGTPSTSSREVEKNPGTSVPSHKPAAVEFANALGGLLGLTYESEDDSETEQEESQAQRNISGTRKGAHGFSGRVTLEGNRLQNFSQNDHSQSDVKPELSGT